MTMLHTVDDLWEFLDIRKNIDNCEVLVISYIVC